LSSPRFCSKRNQIHPLLGNYLTNIKGALIKLINQVHRDVERISERGVSTHPKSTYKIGGTKYNANERYKNSGLPKVERSATAKNQFLRSKGYKKVPSGYEVDHIIPLLKGGRDEPSNMQLIPKSVHKEKTASERKR
jgi:5-methylcytosine-specific restriction endonuclease McrA